MMSYSIGALHLSAKFERSWQRIDGVSVCVARALVSVSGDATMANWRGFARFIPLMANHATDHAMLLREVVFDCRELMWIDLRFLAAALRIFLPAAKRAGTAVTIIDPPPLAITRWKDGGAHQNTG